MSANNIPEGATKTIKELIDDVGYTTPLLIEARTPYHRNTIDKALQNLWSGRHIERPLKGFVVSTEWARKNKKELKKLEGKLNINIAFRD